MQTSGIKSRKGKGETERNPRMFELYSNAFETNERFSNHLSSAMAFPKQRGSLREVMMTNRKKGLRTCV